MRATVVGRNAPIRCRAVAAPSTCVVVTVPPRSEAVVARRVTPAAPPGAVAAVHCKAGAGRTMTLIGLWAIQNGFPARAYLGWARLSRGGESVMGMQQQYLLDFAARAENTCGSRQIEEAITTRGSSARMGEVRIALDVEGAQIADAPANLGR